MDANGQRFWMLAEKADWHLWSEASTPPTTEYEVRRRTLRLANQRPAVNRPDNLAAAASRLARVPGAMDAFGTRAFWSPSDGKIMAVGALSTPVEIYAAPSPTAFVTDLTMGVNGVLYIAVDEAVVMIDRRERWAQLAVTATDRGTAFKAWRLAADPSGGVWVVDRIQRKLAKVVGEPLADLPGGPPAPDVFRPSPENPNLPRTIEFPEATWPGNEEAVAIACSAEGRLALLTWPAGPNAAIRLLTSDGRFGPPSTLEGAGHPYSIAWVSDTDIAVLVADTSANSINEAPVYAPLEQGGIVRPLGGFYPLRDHDGGPFLHAPALPPHYGSLAGPVPLVRLSLPAFAPHGEANSSRPFDGGRQTVWHRLYLEAAIPPGCGVRVWLAASDEYAMPLKPGPAWHEHRFGAIPEPSSAAVPHGAWVPQASEIPFQSGLLCCARVKDRSGLFTALVQRAGYRVRTLRGRYLWAHLELFGTGRSTPEVAALRVYGSRFSYLNRYLPELYRETVFGDDADECGRSTGADFLERFLDNFEGVLTPLEDRIASSYLLTDPRTVPEESIEWLGNWIGVTFDAAFPEERRRALLGAAPDLYRARGTPRGLGMAIDLATGGAVSSGEVVVLEDFRLRRTFATILGADLADENDPLLAGLVSSGNSFVGDTLFLGDEHRAEFLALFNAELPTSAAEQGAIGKLFDDLANRVTVLVHQEIDPQDLGLIARIVEIESPAHVLGRVLTASNAFLVGVASLVGVDTYLGRRPPIGPVRLEQSHLGLRDLLQRPASLDPRLEGGRSIAGPLSPPPVADAGPPQQVRIGDSFVLDAGRSRAAPGQEIVRFKWHINP